MCSILLLNAGSLTGTVYSLTIQNKGVIAYLIGNWVLALPVGLLLAHKYGYEMKGLYLAQIGGQLLVLVWYIVLIEKHDWQQTALEVQERIQRE